VVRYTKLPALLLVGLLVSSCGSGSGRAVPANPAQTNNQLGQQQLRVPSAKNDLTPPYVRGETVRHYFDRVVKKIPDQDVDANIEASIVGNDRAVIRSVMLSEPQWARENVIFVDKTGHVYANKAKLIATTSIARPVPGTNDFVDQHGRRFAGPPVTEKPRASTSSAGRRPLYGTPSPTTNSGPYRRMYSDPGIWYAGGLHTIIPSGATNSNSEGPYSDTGFVYSGGWSSSGADSADGGLQYSASRGVSNAFISVRSTNLGIITDLGQDYAPDVDLEADFAIGNGSCYQDSSCRYNAANLTTFVWGTFAYGQGFGGRTIAVQPSNIGDWTANGTVLKDMVSIGQDINSQPDGVFHDGYSFGPIAIDYCGWEGQGFNYCYPSAPQAYHPQTVYPSMVSLLDYPNYDEGVDIAIPTQ
jgi:hypothetical protein